MSRPAGSLRRRSRRTCDDERRANHVVLCGNVQVGRLMPKVASTLIPITTYVITTAPLGPALAEAIGFNGGVSDSDRADNHYRIVGGDRLMWSGRATTWRRDAKYYVAALKEDGLPVPAETFDAMLVAV